MPSKNNKYFIQMKNELFSDFELDKSAKETIRFQKESLGARASLEVQGRKKIKREGFIRSCSQDELYFLTMELQWMECIS